MLILKDNDLKNIHGGDLIVIVVPPRKNEKSIDTFNTDSMTHKDIALLNAAENDPAHGLKFIRFRM